MKYSYIPAIIKMRNVSLFATYPEKDIVFRAKNPDGVYNFRRGYYNYNRYKITDIIDIK